MKFREDNMVAIVKEYNEFKGIQYPAFSANKQKSMKMSTGILMSSYPLLTDFHIPGLGVCFDFYRNRPYEKFGMKTRVSFNILEYKKEDSYSFIIEIPIGVSYRYVERTRLTSNVFGGISPFVTIDSYISYGERHTSSDFFAFLYLGTGFDYKIKKSALRFEISLIPMTFIFAYIF